jgi:hypothetical protein
LLGLDYNINMVKDIQHSAVFKSLFLGGVVLLILVSLTGFWLQRTMFNNERFTMLAQEAFMVESSRVAIGELVSDRVLDEKPALQVALGGRLTELVASVLATERAQQYIERLARESHLLVTSPRRDPLVFELAGLKTAVVRAQELSGRSEGEVRIDAESLPDEIMLIDTEKLPNIYRYGVVVMWVGPISFLAALIMLAWWVRQSTVKMRYLRIRTALYAVLAACLLALVLGPLVEPTFVSVGRDAPSQSLLRNIYESFITPFRNQALWLGAITLLILASVTVWEKVLSKYRISIKLTKKT